MGRSNWRQPHEGDALYGEDHTAYPYLTHPLDHMRDHHDAFAWDLQTSSYLKSALQYIDHKACPLTHPLDHLREFAWGLKELGPFCE
jgi:hypothetical protein